MKRPGAQRSAAQNREDVRAAIDGVGPLLRRIYPPDAQADAVLEGLINRLEGLPGPTDTKIDGLIDRLGKMPGTEGEVG